MGICWACRRRVQTCSSDATSIRKKTESVSLVGETKTLADSTDMATRIIIHKERRTAQCYTEKLGEDVELALMSIPGGTFWMGTPEAEIERLCKEYNEDYFRRESPQHKVTVPAFFMGKYQVTQAQWKAIAEREDLKVKIDLDPDPSGFKEPYETYSRWDRPVEQVNWYEAKEFCTRLSKLTGKQYRLPTEAEWEYACRSVIRDRLSVNSEELTVEEWNEKYHQPFHFGETISTKLANYSGTDWELKEGKVYPGKYGRGLKGEYREQTTPVGYFGVANAFGLYDMHGNIWEWCEDDWHDKYDGAPIDGSAWLIGDKNAAKIRRGGSWFNDPIVDAVPPIATTLTPTTATTTTVFEWWGWSRGLFSPLHSLALFALYSKILSIDTVQ